jgi:hypothetical protein
MRFAGRVWREGKLWLAEVPILDAMTLGPSRRAAIHRMTHAIEKMAKKRAFRVAVFQAAGGAFEIGSEDADTLVALMLRSRGAKARAS